MKRSISILILVNLLAGCGSNFTLQPFDSSMISAANNIVNTQSAPAKISINLNILKKEK